MNNGRILYDLAQERHKEMLREAEQERILRRAKSGSEPHQSLLADWIMSLRKTLLSPRPIIERDSGTGVEVEIQP
jgi:hypothetical protein